MTPRAPHGADLHLHTLFSDGTCTPEELIADARQVGLAAIALTDHDALAGLERAQRAAGDGGPEVIPGVEFSAPSRADGIEEAHIVGLFLDPGSPALTRALERFRRNRRERAMEIVERLNKLGVPLRTDAVFAQAGEGNVGRLHVARALLEAGHIESIQKAFHRWIRVGRPAYVPRERPPAPETIELIHRAGGIAVMAHPGQTGSDNDLPSLAEAGLDGIEVYCPEHSGAQRQRYLGLAHKHDLLVSGGSDYHGRNKNGNAIGCVRLDLKIVAALRERALGYRTS